MRNRVIKTYVSTAQRETLLLLASGKSYRTIATELGLTERAVRARTARLRARFGVRSSLTLVVAALQQNVIVLDEIEIEYMEE